MTLKDYPFAKKVITDKNGNISQIILDFKDYQQLLEILEDEGLYRAIKEVREETPLSLEEALQELENE